MPTPELRLRESNTPFSPKGEGLGMRVILQVEPGFEQLPVARAFQAKAELLEDMLHGLVVGRDESDDTAEFLIACDLHVPAHHLTAQAKTLARVADETLRRASSMPCSLVMRLAPRMLRSPVLASSRSATSAISRS